MLGVEPGTPKHGQPRWVSIYLGVLATLTTAVAIFVLATRGWSNG